MKKEELIKAIETIIHKYKNDHSSWYVAKKIYNLIKSSPQHETSKVIINKQVKEFCGLKRFHEDCSIWFKKGCNGCDHIIQQNG